MFPLSESTTIDDSDVHAASTNVHRFVSVALSVSRSRIVFAAVAGQVAVVAVYHRQAGAHVAGQIEGGNTGTKSEGRKRVAQIVNPAQRLDPHRELGRLPLAVTEVV
jgi:hypothetical protein